MYPLLALAEVLTEGLVYYRRAITVQRVANTASEVYEIVDSLTSDNLRKHRSVPGDDAYLWLLGHTLIAHIAKRTDGPYPTEKVLTNVPLAALTNNSFVMTSPDAKSMTTSYLYALGAEWQDADDDAFTRMKQLLDSIGVLFTINDPVYTLFTEIDVLPVEFENPITQLGVTRDELNRVITQFKTSDMAKVWTEAVNKGASDGITTYKVESAIGIMMTGARSRLPLTSTEIPLNARYPNLGFSLNAGYLFKETPLNVHHENIAQGVSITKEQIEQMSKQTMAAKGYVNANGAWIKVEAAKYVPASGEGSKLVEEAFSTQVTASIASQLAARAETKLSAMARLNRIKKLIKP